MQRLAIILVAVVAAACVTVQPITDYRAAKKYELCDAYQQGYYGKQSDPLALAEIERRMKMKAYPPVDFEVLRTRELMAGAHRNTVKCIMQLPEPEYTGSTALGNYEEYALSSETKKQYGIKSPARSRTWLHFSDRIVTQIHHNPN